MAEAKSWNSDIKTWKQRNQILFKNEIMSDCSFKVMEGTEKTIIPAHKYVLGGNSAEFYNLFYLMKSSDEIPIEDITANHLTTFLEFLYTEKTTVTMENVGELLKLARRYSVSHLEEFCGEFLSQNVNTETALSVMEKYSDYLMPSLMDKCTMLLSHNRMFFETPSFLKVSILTLTALIKSDELAFKEKNIFDGVNKWAENFCQENNQMINSENKRLAVKPALKFIRFAAIPLKEFPSCTLNNSILTSAEIIQIYQFIATAGESECTFSDKKRHEIKTLTFKFDLGFINSSNFAFDTSSQLYTSQISVNKQIYLHGFGILGRAKNALTLQNPEKLTIKLRDNLDTVLLESVVEIHYDGSQKTYDLLFDNSMLLKPDITYKASIHRQINGTFENYYVGNTFGNTFGTTKFVKEFDGVVFDVNENYFFKSIIFSKAM